MQGIAEISHDTLTKKERALHHRNLKDTSKRKEFTK